MAKTTLTRLSEKASTERSHLDALLDEAMIGHVGLNVDGSPVVVPTLIAREGDRLVAHGSTGSRWMRLLAAGADVSVGVTAVDALVVARSAFESSLRYRSAVLFGRCSPIDEAAEKQRLLDLLTEKLVPHRVAELRRPTPKELAATLVLTMPIDEWSLKVSDGWPDDPPEDVAGDAWAGIVPLVTEWGDPVAAPDLRSGIAVPPSVRALPSRIGRHTAEH